MTLVLWVGLLSFAILGHGYLWTDAVNRMHAWSGPRKIIDLFTLFCFSAFLLLPWIVGLNWGNFALLELSALWSEMSWVHGYFLLCVGWGLYSLIVNGVRRIQTDNPRTLLDWKQKLVGTSATLQENVFREGVPRLLSKVPFNEALHLTTDRKRLAIPRLHSNHLGLTIAHISDLHMTGQMGLPWYEWVVEQVNGLQADVVVVTGDIVEKEQCWPWLASSLGKLHAKYGVYFVFGNHDYYIDTNETKRLLETQGLVCLSERYIETTWNDSPVLLAGNERPWAPQAADLSEVPAKSAEHLPLKLMLLHSPDQFNWACQNDADLALAGHTHGGQLRFPLLGPIVSPSIYGTRYACGVFRRGNTVMHVSRGVAGKTPLRWNCPPEIALLELTEA